MSQTPKVSVVMAVYNAQPYLEAALESVLSQDFTDFEFLAHDDGSSDNSLEVLEAYARKDPRLVVTSGENQGVARAVNGMLERARGTYIARMDSDDLNLPGRFSAQVAYLEAHPDCVALGATTIEMDADGRLVAPITPPLDHATIDAQNLRGNNSLHQPVIMLRRAAVEQVGRYNPDMPAASDLDMWLRMGEVGKLANLAEPYLLYRHHAKSISTSRNAEQTRLAHEACRRALARRGLPDRELVTTKDRAALTDATRATAYIRTGWRAWKHGYRDTWRHYAWQALRAAPLSVAAWKLVILGGLRRPDA